MANSDHTANTTYIAATILQAVSGENDFIIVPKMLVRLTGSLEAGILLSRALYWHSAGKNGKPRIKRPDGFFYKSDREWGEELCLTRHSVRSATKRLHDMGILQTKKLQANGKPTMHYRIDFKVLEQRLVKQMQVNISLSEIEQSDCLESDNDVSEIEQSITKTTTNTTTKKSQRSTTANASVDVPSFASSQGRKANVISSSQRPEDSLHVNDSVPRPTGRSARPSSCDVKANACPDKVPLMDALTAAKKFVKGEAATMSFGDKDMQAIRSLIEKECTARQAFDCYVFSATSTFWLHKDMTSQTVLKRFDEWLQNGQPFVNEEAPMEIKQRCKQRLAERKGRVERERVEAEAVAAGFSSVEAYITARDELVRVAHRKELEARFGPHYRTLDEIAAQYAA